MIAFAPTFPPFDGPLEVGTTTFEVPVEEIHSPTPAAQENVSTIKVRVFYPTSADTSKASHVWWLQEPQSDWVQAYSKFLGASDRLARAISYVPTGVKRAKIPAIANGPLGKPLTASGKWPVALFSHGLGGSYNAYSYLCGSLASCGMVVFAPEHRDGSCPISHIHNSEGSLVRKIGYRRLKHEPTEEVLDARNDQLRIRLTELDLLYSLIEDLNQGTRFTNAESLKAPTVNAGSINFTSRLDLTPASVTWVGHSFGAATMVQFLKSVYWARVLPQTDGVGVLYTPADNTKVNKQVTPKSPLILLDLWTMPLAREKSQWLYDRPLPCFADENPTTSTVLSIMSQEFYNWEELRERTKYVLSGRPEESGVQLKETSEKTRFGPRLFWVKDSAHLSQSDFNILFPWLTRRLADEPERIMNLNMRAILQLLRENSVPTLPIKFYPEDAEGQLDAKTHQDESILAENGDVRNWNAIPLSH